MTSKLKKRDREDSKTASKEAVTFVQNAVQKMVAKRVPETAASSMKVGAPLLNVRVRACSSIVVADGGEKNSPKLTTNAAPIRAICSCFPPAARTSSVSSVAGSTSNAKSEGSSYPCSAKASANFE